MPGSRSVPLHSSGTLRSPIPRVVSLGFLVLWQRALVSLSGAVSVAATVTRGHVQWVLRLPDRNSHQCGRGRRHATLSRRRASPG